MKIIREFYFHIIGLLIAILILLLKVPKLESISYSIIIIDIFAVYLKLDILKRLTVYDLISIDNDIVYNATTKDIREIKDSIKIFNEKKEFIIKNPITASDISEAIINSLRKTDTLFASMDCVERQYLLQPKNTTHINQINEEAINRCAGNIKIIRVLIVNDEIKENKLYKDFRTQQKKIGVDILECTPEEYKGYFRSAVIIKLSHNINECLIGDTDPNLLVHKYEAKYILGSKVQESKSNFEELLRFLHNREVST